MAVPPPLPPVAVLPSGRAWLGLPGHGRDHCAASKEKKR